MKIDREGGGIKLSTSPPFVEEVEEEAAAATRAECTQRGQIAARGKR